MFESRWVLEVINNCRSISVIWNLQRTGVVVMATASAIMCHSLLMQRDWMRYGFIPSEKWSMKRSRYKFGIIHAIRVFVTCDTRVFIDFIDKQIKGNKQKDISSSRARSQSGNFLQWSFCRTFILGVPSFYFIWIHPAICFVCSFFDQKPLEIF